MADGTKMYWDLNRLCELKKCIALAKENGDEMFTLNGHEFLVSYAEYLAEHLTANL